MVAAVHDGRGTRTETGTSHRADAAARALAETQRSLRRDARLLTRFFEAPPVSRALGHARAQLVASTSSDARLRKAAEWFLDNYYLIRRVARQVEAELPRGFVRHLPQLADGPDRGTARVEALARALVAGSDLTLGFSELRRFLDAYQEVSPLTIAELWALPTMLRAATLGHLLSFLDALGVPFDERDRRAFPPKVTQRSAGSPPAFDAGVGVERAVHALRALDTMDWKEFFEQSNRVEAILRTDPAQLYSRMEFATCDRYRKVVEVLAWATGASEQDVASAAISLAAQGGADPRRGHVGYYLVDQGRAALEAQVGYRPVGMERVRRLVQRWPTAAYLLPLAVLTALALAALGAVLAEASSLGAAVIALLLAVAAVPVSAVAVAALQLGYAHLLPPRLLPKLDFEGGLPDGLATLIVMPTLLGRAEDVATMLRNVELHYFSNPDPALQFALLTDHLDARDDEPESSKQTLLDAACAGVVALNLKHGVSGQGPFHLLHRAARWNPAEERFMGWERKRGKLEELNRLLRGDLGTSYCRHVGDPRGLRDVRFVITLDADTELPLEGAHRLIGALAHPLNRAVFDERGRVIAGYTIIQPRVETAPSSLRQTLLSRAFAGDIGFDIYAHACSELYQDLFGAGIYVGKGIYDVDAFMRSTEGRAPENALVSHDLFEGIHGRAALATDIVLYESYPSSYLVYAARMHRWVRGDWQLVPWLRSKVASAAGAAPRHSLALIDRWKIADNLRRSLTTPMLLLLLVLGWSWLPTMAVGFTAAVVALGLAPALPAYFGGRRRRRAALVRAAVGLGLWAYEAVVVVDAIVRVATRKAVTKKRLLQWTSAAHSTFAARSAGAAFWRAMVASPAVAVLLGAALAWQRPGALWAAAPLLAAWALAPELARRISAVPRALEASFSGDERRRLRLLARRTWRFFEAFVGPRDQWLPIDNYQEAPHQQTAHRTSPTNIGLSMLATLSAYDLGYLGPSELALRLRRAFESIARLAHHEGHLLNWYDTQSLQPLLPRYVSTVDSGNFAGCLVALRQGCQELTRAPVVRAASWEGLLDSLELLAQPVRSLPAAGALREVISGMQDSAQHAREHLEDSLQVLRRLSEASSLELERELLALLGSGALRHEVELLHSLRTSSAALHLLVEQLRRELEALAPWLVLGEDATACGLVLPTGLCLDEIPDACQRLLGELAAPGEPAAPGDPAAPAPARPEACAASAQRLTEAFTKAAANATALVAELGALAALAGEEVRGMDFGMLYDRERRLFHIGHNVTSDQVDPNHYDLLASEARLTSFLAIVKRDVPEAHWVALGRPLTPVGGAPALLSWGGTMFEYLMPELLMRSQPETLLARTTALAVDAQIAYGAQTKAPWGISESAYARLDAGETYQYQSFGVPGLGLRRGLEEDQVISPYSCLLALAIRPRAVLDNLRDLEARGMLGPYGFFEALDLTPERQTGEGEGSSRGVVVRSYMAHHQGMILVSLGNLLAGRSMVERFHADPMIEAGEVLLNEQAPEVAPKEWPRTQHAKIETAAPGEALAPLPASWSAAALGGAQAFALGNGQLTSLVTGSGGGGLRWRGLALTRYQPDATSDDDGLWIYLRDEDSGQIWLATSQRGQTTYSMHKVEHHLRSQGISIHVEVAVAASDDVEVRHVTLHNETAARRRLTVTSAGRPVLFDAAGASSHPMFSSLFVNSEWEPALEALVFSRRAQSDNEEPAVLVHRLVCEGPSVLFAGYQTERGAFLGRGGSLRAPRALEEPGGLRGQVGAVLDPVMCLMAEVTLEPKSSVTLAFVTAVASERAAALELARKYTLHAVRWAFVDAEQAGPRRLARLRLDPSLLPTVQRLTTVLLFGDPALRVSAAARAAAAPRQARLWGRGISGDEPIVLLRVRDPQAGVLREVLAAQRYLRFLGVSFDLVLVDEQASGYAGEGVNALRSALAASDAEQWRDRRGGVFVLVGDQVPPEELTHLEACARVVLDSGDGSLAARLHRVDAPRSSLPWFTPSLDAEDSSRRVPRPALEFDNGTGGFSQDGREYILEVPPGTLPPAPWCNVLANAECGAMVSEAGLGMTWSLNSGENRLTPWHNDAVRDPPSEALYLRDEETASVWSPTPLPAGLSGHTLVRHGAGYTSYERESHGLWQELTVFVPPAAGLKVVRLRLRNLLPRHRRLTATYYAEWVLGRQLSMARPPLETELVHEQACALATSTWSADFGGRVAFLAARHPVHGFTADRAEFLGGGSLAQPEALARWGLSGSTEPSGAPCAALQVHLELSPQEERETHFVLGQAASRDAALALASRFREPEVVSAAWRELADFWDERLGVFQVKTPEPAMDLMLNRWLLYQTLSARVLARTGFYQSSGAFGYRDQLQDILALLAVAPQQARAHLLEAARHQFVEGDVLHWWHPPSGRGVRTRCSDDLAWLPYVTAEYVAATGDAAILDESVTFLEGEALRADEAERYAEFQPGQRVGSLFEHCRLAVERALTEGSHGLPLMGTGDWNDGMSRVGAQGRGESVWLGWFLCAVMERLAALTARRGALPEATSWRSRALALRARVEAAAWDGAWYLRAFHDDGSRVGSAASRECSIDSIAQSWAVLSRRPGEEASERDRAAVRAADSRLVRAAERLVLLFWPPFDHTLHDPGYVRAYPPGVRENGGQYTHAAVWLGLAHARMGDGGGAERIFALLNPVLRSSTAATAERYRVEPYVLAADIYGCAPWVGRGGWTWYTGAAAWLWRLGVEGILGLRHVDGHLHVAPCLPARWPGFEAWVRLGLARVHVVVSRGALPAGGAPMTLDGAPIDPAQLRVDRAVAASYELRLLLPLASPLPE